MVSSEICVFRVFLFMMQNKLKTMKPKTNEKRKKRQNKTAESKGKRNCLLELFSLE